MHSLDPFDAVRNLLDRLGKQKRSHGLLAEFVAAHVRISAAAHKTAFVKQLGIWSE